jgi:hypothetical protein
MAEYKFALPKKIVIIIFRGWLIGQAIGSTSLRVIIYIREGVYRTPSMTRLLSMDVEIPRSHALLVAEPSFLPLQSAWLFDWIWISVELISNRNISHPSLLASESQLFVAIHPTSRLALASSHMCHAQASRSGSREFQFLGLILVERNRTHLYALAELPTPTNRLVFASLLHCFIASLLHCFIAPSPYVAFSLRWISLGPFCSFIMNLMT